MFGVLPTLAALSALPGVLMDLLLCPSPLAQLAASAVGAAGPDSKSDARWISSAGTGFIGESVLTVSISSCGAGQHTAMGQLCVQKGHTA